jgi:hypothetical protein
MSKLVVIYVTGAYKLWKDNIKMVLREAGWEGADCIYVA